ncbi:MAG TPA: hypothetical protein P5076_07945, partial [Myxococcota bacterium]|nr:hypothetical protein [Myxococcota bacterium]
SRRLVEGRKSLDHGLLQRGMGDGGLRHDGGFFGVFIPHNIWAVFADTVQFGALCREQGVELVYAADHLRSRLDGCGAAFLPLGCLRPGLCGVEPNLRAMLAAVDPPTEVTAP